MEDEKIYARLVDGAQQEPYARLLGMKVKEVRKGHALAEMRFVPGIENIFGMAHGGAIYSLLDEAFQAAANSHGSLAVALNMSVTYVNAPEPGALLLAEAQEVCLTRKTATYAITVKDESGRIIATCQALAYQKGGPLPFVQGS